MWGAWWFSIASFFYFLLEEEYFLGPQVDVDEKYERRRGASLPDSSIIKDYNTIFEQFLINFTSTSSSLNFGTIIKIISWLDQNLSNLDLNVLVDSACTTSFVRLFHILFKKNLRRSYLARFFCNLKSLPLVVRVGDVVKIGIAAESYLPDNI